MGNIIRKSKFLHQVSILFTVQTLCKIIPIIANLFVLQIYTADVFGQFGLIVTWMEFARSIANLKLENAILSSKGKNNIMVGSAACLLVSSGIMILQLFIIFVIQLIYDFSSYYFLIGIYTFVGSIYNLQFAIALKLGRIRNLAWSKILETLSFNILIILLGVFNNTIASLLISSFASVLIGVTILRRYIYLDSLSSVSKAIGFIKQHYRYPLYLSTASLIEAAAYNLHILILSLFYSTTFIGELFWVQRILNVPLNIITPINQLLIKQLTVHSCNIASIYSKISSYTKLSVLGSLIISIMILYVPNEIIIYLTPSHWSNLITIFQISLPAFLLIYIWKILTAVLMHEHKQNLILVFDIGIFMLSMCILLVGSYLNTPFIQLLLLLTAAKALITLLVIIKVMRVIANPLNGKRE
jgi:O-antigen/teichoic acid export membrane protein